MPDSSARLDLPFIMPSQAQKHVTHNEAIELLDLLVQLTVAAFDATSPPTEPAEGQVWALGAAPGGVWAGHAETLAAFVQGGWVFIPPRPGWRAVAGAELRIWSGSAWVLPTVELQNLPGLGVNAASDATNRLAVAAEATLLSHDGAGHQLKINKATPGDTASLLFQTGFSGRAEMGTAGDDDFAIKVSVDGAAWQDGIVIDAGSGTVGMPNGATVQGPLTGTAVTQSPTDTTAGRLLKVGDFGLGERNTASPAGQDLDDVTAAQFNGWSGASAPANSPGGGGSLIVAPAQGNRVIQMWGAASAVQPELYLRARSTQSSWSDWFRFYNENNILGTVSQSGGTPTGAIIERGSGPNGSYVRFADGTQICWGVYERAGVNLTAAWGGGFRNTTDSGNGTLPAAFVDNDVRFGLSVNSLANGEAIPIWAAAQFTGTQIAVRFWRPSSATDQSVSAEWIAIGRWY